MTSEEGTFFDEEPYWHGDKGLDVSVPECGSDGGALQCPTRNGKFSSQMLSDARVTLSRSQGQPSTSQERPPRHRFPLQDGDDRI